MDRFAVFVDAGYLFAAGAELVLGGNRPRREIRIVDPESIVESLSGLAKGLAGGLPLLRVYWYDAMPGPALSLEQSQLAMLPGVKLRLGALNSTGQQKGVDALILTDLIELARNGAIAEAVVLSGDEDIRVGIQVAQTYGVRAHVLAISPARNNVSQSLQMEVDSIREISAAELSPHLTLVRAPMPSSQVPTPEEEVEGTDLEAAALTVIDELLGSVAVEELVALYKHFELSNSVPMDFDRRLIAKVSTAVGRRFEPAEMRTIRGLFVVEVRNRSAESSSESEEIERGE